MRLSVSISTYIVFVTWIRSVACSRWIAVSHNSDLVSLSAYNEIQMHSSIHCATSCNKSTRCRAFIFAKSEALNCLLLDTSGLGTCNQPSPGARFFIKWNNAEAVDTDGYRMVEYSEGVYIYKFHLSVTTLESARLTCVSEGGQVIGLTSKSKHSSIISIIQSNSEYSSQSGYHTDGSNIDANNYLDKTQWKLSNGETLPPDLWLEALPNDGNVPRCIWIWKNLNWELDDVPCDTHQTNFICEKLI